MRLKRKKRQFYPKMSQFYPEFSPVFKNDTIQKSPKNAKKRKKYWKTRRFPVKFGGSGGIRTHEPVRTT